MTDFSPSRFASCVLAASALAVSAPTASAQVIDFDVDGGRVVPSEAFAVKVSVLGAAITSGGEDMPVTVEVQVGDESFEPFGSADSASDGDVNDGLARSVVFSSVFSADAGVTVTGNSFKSSGGQHMTRNSHDESTSVRVLRDGDPIPKINAFQNQQDVATYVQEYTDPSNGVMMMHPNQAIYLFELGVTNLDSSAADFQDLVVLVTFGESPEQLASNPLPDPGTVEPLYD